jgi:hypothetical protein
MPPVRPTQQISARRHRLLIEKDGHMALLCTLMEDETELTVVMTHKHGNKNNSNT